jgi:hypothetical protein
MKNLVFAAFAAAFFSMSVNAQVINPDSLDRSADDAAVKEFLESNNKFEEKANGSMPFEDRQIAFVGGKSEPVTLSKMIQRGWFLGGGVALTATMGDNAMVGPKFFVSGGYEGNKWGAYADLGYLKVHTHSQSDWQGSVNALEFNFGLTRSLKQWHDHHTHLSGFAEVNFRNTFDRKDLGNYEKVSVEETETEIVTTTETGWKIYEVKPYMFGCAFGLELSHQFYNKPIGIFAKVGAGFTTQFANDSSKIYYNPTGSVSAGVRFYLHGKAKNKKASEMIRHY